MMLANVPVVIFGEWLTQRIGAQDPCHLRAYLCGDGGAGAAECR
jgi:hypothetical protein